jgi:Flp pilus assembly protein TadD
VAVGSNANDAENMLRVGHQHFIQGMYQPAAAAYQSVLQINPRHAIALNYLGAALGSLGQYRQAESHFRHAIEIDPNYPEAHCNLGAALRATAQLENAQQALKTALRLRPDYPDALTHLGLILLALGRTTDARRSLERASRLVPNNTATLMGLTELARMDGRFKEAETILKRVLKIDQHCSSALASLASLRKQTTADGGWLQQAEQMLAGPLTPLAEVNLRFAVGKYFDDVGEFACAFANYQRGNQILKGNASQYDHDAHTRFVDDLIRVYVPGRVAAHVENPHRQAASMKPVLVVGMPRSGTSLVEQIIASHPAARGAGELQFWTAAMREHEATVRCDFPDEALRHELGAAYLSVLNRLRGDAACVIDKAPVNADYLGIIHAALPQARFVYMQRDPIDTCLSCYFQQFSAGMKFSMDLTDLARYYRQHQRLMSHWRAILPPQTLLNVPYAELVANPTEWIRKILDFIGLEWNERCLNFHSTRRPVATASAWQVRQKIYSSSVQRWRHYQEFIGPLLELRDSTT